MAKDHHEEIIVVLDYTENQTALSSTANNLPLAMLPIGNKPMIQHQIEWLCDAGFKNIHIALPDHHAGSWLKMLRHFRFGVRLTHSMHRGLAHFEMCRRVFLSHQSGVLWMSGHALTRVKLPQSFDGSSLFIRTGEYLPLIYLQKRDVFLMMPQLSRLEHMSWQNLICEVLPNIQLKVVQGFMSVLRSAWDYENLCRLVLTGQTPLQMRDVVAREGMTCASAPHRGKGAKALKHNILGEHVALGSRVTIENCILGDGVFIDEGASLTKCIVISDTYIGKGIHLENKLICGDFIFDFPANIGQRIGDRHFCSSRDEASHPLVALISKLLLRGAVSA
jgi:NDP-sugar pyrophosphorylase family protein